MLAHAVKGAALFDDVGAIDADDLSAGEAITQNPKCLEIVLELIVGRD
jgi:hypothetical protein